MSPTTEVFCISVNSKAVKKLSPVNFCHSTNKDVPLIIFTTVSILRTTTPGPSTSLRTFIAINEKLYSHRYDLDQIAFIVFNIFFSFFINILILYEMAL